MRYDGCVSTYHVENFGCRATQADGAAIERQFENRGLIRSSAAEADLVILNTCTVTNSADHDARAAVRRVRRKIRWQKSSSPAAMPSALPKKLRRCPESVPSSATRTNINSPKLSCQI